MDRNIRSGQIELREGIMYVLLQFPISSILKVYISPLNLILTGLCFCMFALYFTTYGISKNEFLLLLYVVLGIVANCFICEFSFFSTNMLFYFPFLICFFMFFAREKDFILSFIAEHKSYIDIILFIWCVAILLSLFLPSSYVYEGETRGFVSFAGSTFLLAPIAIYIFVLLTIQYELHRSRIYMIALIVPSICILFGTTRTYLAGLFCAWMVFAYLNLKNKKLLFPLLIAGLFIFVLIVIASPIADKFMETYGRTDTSGLDAIDAITSGRSIFWAYDMDVLLHNNLISKILGNGVNYLFDLNDAKFNVALWAHNDFIQIFSDYGILGISIYLGMFAYITKRVFRNARENRLIIAIILMMWIFIAFFNMFYTYFCTMLAFPFYFLVADYNVNSCSDNDELDEVL